MNSKKATSFAPFRLSPDMLACFWRSRRVDTNARIADRGEKRKRKHGHKKAMVSEQVLGNQIQL